MEKPKKRHLPRSTEFLNPVQPTPIWLSFLWVFRTLASLEIVS
jgi:hypothetical protein